MKLLKEIILDTNAVMAIAEWKVDIFRELERVLDFPYHVSVLAGAVKELQDIQARPRLRLARAARLGLQILKAKKVKVLSSPAAGKVDDLLAEYSQQGALVLTQDRELKRRLSRPYLTIRQKKKIMLVC